MAEVLCWNTSVLTSDSPSGNEKRLSEVGCAFGSFKFEVVVDLSDFLHFTAGVPSHSVFVGSGSQGVYDGLGFVGGGEHPTVRFNLKFDALVCEPSDGVGRLEAMESANKVLNSARIVFYEFPGVIAAVGDITSTSARDADFV